MCCSAVCSANEFDDILFFNQAFAQSSSNTSHAYHIPLTFEERVACRKAIEEVYWKHRIWPKENPQPKPLLETIMPDEVIRAKVEDIVRKSNALEYYWKRTITGEQLQAE